MNGTQRHEVAARIRGLIGGQDSGAIEATAKRLRVEELSLRISIDEQSPYPTLDVLLAVVSVYAVDPHWLLTGTYDAATHRRVLEGDAHAAAEAIRSVSGDVSTKRPVATPTDGNRLHIA